MLFGKYLKLCRDKYRLTQEDLVQQCYRYDDSFNGLDIGTISRWERGITNPSFEKQIKITKFFQRYENRVLPYFESFSTEDIEKKINKQSIINLIGNSKEHILKFPHSDVMAKNLKLSKIKEYENKEALLKMPNDVLQSLLNNYYELDVEILKAWSELNSNLFLVCEYEGHFFGLFFSLRLKPKVFEEIISFQRELKTLKEEDFSKEREIGCVFPISMFAYNKNTAMLLYTKCIANLISNQDYILEVGSIPVLKGGVKLAEKINLQQYLQISTEGCKKISYRASLEDILLREEVFKILFKK